MLRGSFALVFVCCLACESDRTDAGGALRPEAGTIADARAPDAARLDAAPLDAARADATAPDATSPDASRSAAGGGGAPPASDAGGELDAGAEPTALRIEIFSRTAGYRHDSIEPAQRALADIAQRRGAVLGSTEDPAALIARLPHTDVVVFLMTTGDVLDDAQQREFEAFIRAGGGFAGVHSAADTEYGWPFYGELNGAWFADHPAVQPAKILVDAPADPRVSFLPAEWQRTDEWYNFRANPRARVQVLLRLDETSYSGGTMGADHPIAWTREIDSGRAFYTGLGHTRESWQEPLLLRHVEEGVLWAAGR